MKASEKTIATNASVNGFGASKRIIIWTPPWLKNHR